MDMDTHTHTNLFFFTQSAFSGIYFNI